MRNAGLFLGTLLMIAMGGAYLYFGGFSYGQGSQPAAGVPVVQKSSASVAVSFAELAKGTQSTVTKRTNYLITSTSELSALWKMVDAKGQIPVVDFKTNIVIAAFAGTKPTAGYDIRITGVEDNAMRLVTVTLSTPDSSCLLAQSLTSPYQIMELPKTTLPLTHNDLGARTSCLP